MTGFPLIDSKGMVVDVGAVVVVVVVAEGGANLGGEGGPPR